ncbi:acyltransferase [Photobacterium kishitanii]|uniref:acyltransferase family protein n=1 Tax=Photobacterium kishitanii TaxID=318456 RepID=UPI000D16B082|nr:acyltransferase [Photobacterium kishitanii]PSU88816.1 acyltransferase [Photobacterium kishitanii]
MIYSIHALRAIACIMVFFAHYRTINGLSHSSNDFFSMGAYGVDIFFIISGFVIASMINKYNKDEVRKYFKVKFLLSRIIRIILPMWAAMILLFLVVGNYSGIENFIKSFFLIPSYNLFYKSNVYYLEPQWSLLFELFFYILVTIMMSYKRFNMIIFTVIIMLFISSILYTNVYLLKPILIEFMFGIIVFKIVNYYDIDLKFKYILLSCLIFIISSYMMKNQAGNIDSVLRVFVIGIPASLVILSLSLSKTINIKVKDSKIIMFLGNISFSLYLTHMMSLRLYSHYFINSSVLILFFLVLFNSIVFYYLIEYPCHKLSKKLLGYD